MDVQSWIRTLVEKGVGAAAIKRAYNLTSSVMRAAFDDDVIAVSPRPSIDLPQIAVKPPQWFTLDQAQRILDDLPAVWRTMCLLGFYTGLPPSATHICNRTLTRPSSAPGSAWTFRLPSPRKRSVPPLHGQCGGIVRSRAP